jgi:hypothetical protein
MIKVCRLLLDAFCTAEQYSSLDPTNIKCSINKQSREQMLQCKLNLLDLITIILISAKEGCSIYLLELHNLLMNTLKKYRLQNRPWNIENTPKG